MKSTLTPSETIMSVGELLHNVIDEMLEGFQVIDKDWKYLYVNETVARQGKRERKDLIGHTMMECYPGIDSTPLFVQLRKVLQEKVSVRLENEFVFPDGTKGWFELYVHPVDEGILILSVDITARKIAEDKLLQKINELNDLTTVTVDRENRMLELREAIQKLRDLVPSSSKPMVQA